MEITLLKKTWKYHQHLFATEQIYFNIPKSNGEIMLLFVERALVLLASGSAYKNNHFCNTLLSLNESIYRREREVRKTSKQSEQRTVSFHVSSLFADHSNTQIFLHLG